MNIWEWLVIALSALYFILVCGAVVSEMDGAPFWKKVGMAIFVAGALAISVAVTLIFVNLLINYDL